MADAYAYHAEHDSQEQQQEHAPQIARAVAKLKGSSKNSQLRVLAGLLEQLPQDVQALGSAKAQQVLLDALSDRAILHSKQKDVRMYAAACFAQLLRIYAPETPYQDDKQMEAVFELLLWSIEQVAESQAPTYEFAVSVLQTISQTKSYFIMLDWGREEVMLDWVRVLLQCINAGSSALAGPHALEVLVGIVSDEFTSEAVLELLLSHLVPPKSQENPLGCQLAQAVFKACESAIKPALQKYLTTLLLSPISSNTDLHQQCYTLIYQLYMTVPQVLLPVIPHLTSELHSEDGPKRLEACQLLGRLLSLPGNRLVNEYTDVLGALLRRYSDTQVNIRLAMLEFTPALVAAAGSAHLQQQVLFAAAERLQDYDEKVRLAAVKAVCQSARQLLVGPSSSTTAAANNNATAAAGAGGHGGGAGGSGNTNALLSPVDALLGSIGSQEFADAAAADLDLATAADLGSSGPAAAAAAAAVRDLPFVYEALRHVGLRLRDTKPAVRKAAASHLLGIFRAVVAAGDASQISKCCWMVGRFVLCSKSDRELRVLLFEATAKEGGLLGPKTAPAQAAIAWAQLWLGLGELERDALLMMLNTRTRLQVDTLQFLALRRKLSGRQAAAIGTAAGAAGAGDDDEADATRLSLEQACKQLAAQLPQPDRAAETIAALVQVRDNNAFGAMQTALCPGVTTEAYNKARQDALARVGSRSPAAEAVGQLLLWGRPSAWLPTPLLSALLELASDEPEGEQADLVQGAYQLLLAVAKAAPLLNAGLLPELYRLVISRDAELQQLGTQLLARCAAQMRKCGIVLCASPTPATAQLVQNQVLPALRNMARGQPPAAAAAAAADPMQTDGEGNDDDDDDEGGRGGGGVLGGQAQQVAPKAAKWAVFGIAACQDSSSSRRDLQAIADEVAGSLDPAAPDTAAKLQALAVVGRLHPDALGRHMETLLRFVTDEYFNSYLDAAAGAHDDMQQQQRPPGGSGGSSSMMRRGGVGSSMLLTPNSQATASDAGGAGSSSQSVAGGLMLKCGALKALAAGCVPDSDGHDAPVETLRVVARLADFLEGLLEPVDESLPMWMSDATPEQCGQLRLCAALSLLRLARRHDARIPPSTYSALGLMMQDEVEGVRELFAGKVGRLMRYFVARPSSHQLSAKYAAMLPLAAADPVTAHKDKAARLLRGWVHERRAAVQAQLGAAARGAVEGGSTLQDLPEMLLPYGLYLLAHHPDFPMEAEDVNDPACYTPFQHMLQFMTQPLLAASGTHPAGHTAPILLKMCRTIKRCADATDPPCTTPLYSLCDMATNTIEGLAGSMELQLPTQYAGGIVLPRGLYRALDKTERVGDLTYLPPGYEFLLDPQLPAALVAGGAAAGGKADQAAGGGGRGTKSRGAGGGGRGSKRKAAAAAAAGGEEGEGGGAQHASKRARGGGAAAAGGSSKPRSKGRGKAAAAAAAAGGSSGDEGWGSDHDDAPPSAQKADQHLTKRQQVLRQQEELRARAVAPLEAGSSGGDGGGGSQGSGDDAQQHSSQGDEEGGGDSQPRQQRQQARQQAAAGKQQGRGGSKHKQQQQQQQQTARQMKQQQLTFGAAAAAAADASSPAPVKRGRRQAQDVLQPEPPALNGTAGGGGDGGGGGHTGGSSSSFGGGHGEDDGEEEQQQQPKKPAGRGRKAQQQQHNDEVEEGSDGEQEAESPPPPSLAQIGQRSTKQPAGRKATRGAAAAAAGGGGGGDVDEDGDVAMDEDQEQQQQTQTQRATRGRAGAANGKRGGGTQKAAAATAKRGGGAAATAPSGRAAGGGSSRRR